MAWPSSITHGNHKNISRKLSLHTEITSFYCGKDESPVYTICTISSAVRSVRSDGCFVVTFLLRIRTRSVGLRLRA